jgi:hypothetical protein
MLAPAIYTPQAMRPAWASLGKAQKEAAGDQRAWARMEWLAAG